MPAKPFHKTGIAIGTGVFATHVWVYDPRIYLGFGENGFYLYFFNYHSLNEVIVFITFFAVFSLFPAVVQTNAIILGGFGDRQENIRRY